MRDRETELMLEAKAGSQEAFAQLYEHFKKPLANFLYRLCWNAGKVDDLMQEVFLRAWKAAPTYEPRAKVSTWIFRIAHNLWINQSTKKKEHALEGIDQVVTTTPEENLERKELRRTVKQAVDALPEIEREVLILAEYNGFKYQEIADILEIPVGTVKSRMFSATRRLRESLARLKKP